MTDIHPNPTETTRMAADGHARIDRILDAVRAMLDDGELDRAEYSYRDLADDLRQHLKWEEELLLPLYERLTAPAASVETLREEHGRIEAMLRAVDEAFASGRIGTARTTVAKLAELIASHEQREAELLAPYAVRERPAGRA